MSQTTVVTLQQHKANQHAFAVLTAYDATFASVCANAAVDVLLVGDSLGMVLQGCDSTLPVTIDDMVYHTRSVANGNRQAKRQALIMADMPFMSYTTLEQGLNNAKKLMQAGAHCVKIEGDDALVPLVKQLSQSGVPVCAHLGLTPQSVNKLGGYRVQGREQAQADAMQQHALALQEAGADLILLECVPSSVATAISQACRVPVIGIGAGAGTDAQVLVLHDMLGLNQAYVPSFVRNFLTDGRSIPQAIEAYVDAVKNRTFPGSEHEFK